MDEDQILYDEMTRLADTWAVSPDAAQALRRGHAVARRRKVLTSAVAVGTVLAVAAGAGAVANATRGQDTLRVAGGAASCPELLDSPLPASADPQAVAAMLPTKDIKAAGAFLDDLPSGAGPGPSVTQNADSEPIIQVGFTSDPCAHARQLEAQLTEPEALRVFVSSVPRELTDQVVAAVMSSPTKLGNFVTSITPDPRTGRVTIGVFDNNSSVRPIVLSVIPEQARGIVDFVTDLGNKVVPGYSTASPAPSTMRGPT